jgi:hypothetical protein
MLAACLDITELAIHTPGDIDWQSLPEQCLVAMHWRRTRAVEEILRDYQTLVTARHPLDVLISILRFAQHHPATARWLEGEGGNESALIGTRPTDRRFLEYALSDRAAALFSVSVELRDRARSVVRYEDLALRPRQTLLGVLKSIDESAPANLDATIEAHRIGIVRPPSPQHAWRGKPGLWRDVIIDEYRQTIYHRHTNVFRTLGYTVEGPAPDPEQAQRNWMGVIEQPRTWQAATAG